MRPLPFFTLMFLSCISANSAKADVIALDDAVVVTNGRDFDNNDNDASRELGRERRLQRDREDDRSYYYPQERDRVLIYNGNDSNNGGDAFVIKDGRFVRAEDGSYDLGNGSNINVDQGRVNGNVGHVDIRN